MPLSFLELQDAVLGRRFPSSTQRPNAKRWIETAYQDVWSAPRTDERDWSFVRVSRAALAVTAADATPAMPADFGESLAVYDDGGVPLERLSQPDFEDIFTPISSVTGGGTWAYMEVNRQITLGPAPGATTNYSISYRRRVSHRESDLATVTVGPMTEDDDYPLWDDHHSLLIPRAQVIGLLELNDPSWQPLQEEYERQLARMREDHEYVLPQVQWAAANWGV